MKLITSFLLTSEQYNEINKIADEKGNSMASVLREAVSEFLKKYLEPDDTNRGDRGAQKGNDEQSNIFGQRKG